MRAPRVLLCLLPCCTVVTGFDGYDPVPRFQPVIVSGNVDGLDPSKTVTLRLNGESPLDVGNGAFVFPPVLALGAQYLVTVQPDASDFVCSVDHPSGVATRDVANVAVHCVSADATLSSLALSGVPLVPAFAPGLFDYAVTARPHLPGLSAATTTVAATAAHAGANVGVAPSSPVAFTAGTNVPIVVTVTAADGKHSATYTVTVTGTYA